MHKVVDVEEVVWAVEWAFRETFEWIILIGRPLTWLLSRSLLFKKKREGHNIKEVWRKETLLIWVSFKHRKSGQGLLYSGADARVRWLNLDWIQQVLINKSKLIMTTRKGKVTDEGIEYIVSIWIED